MIGMISMKKFILIGIFFFNLFVIATPPKQESIFEGTITQEDIAKHVRATVDKAWPMLIRVTNEQNLDWLRHLQLTGKITKGQQDHLTFTDLIEKMDLSTQEIHKMSLDSMMQERFSLRAIEAWSERVRFTIYSAIDTASKQWYKHQQFEHDSRINRMDKIKEMLSMVGEGIHTTLGDKTRMMYLTAGVAGLIAAYYVAHHTTRITADQIERQLNTPKLLTETSWANPFTRLGRGSWQLIKSLIFRQKSMQIGERVILEPALANQIRVLAESTKKVRAAHTSYQNALLYGEPGTGKTLFATLLAHHAGMDFAIMSGSKFDQFNEEQSLIELNKLFDWLESRSGVILFIDEADSFLGKRSELTLKGRRLLNEFLHRSGSQSKKFMIICATNRPDMLDKAVVDRLAVKVEFKKPGYDERLKMFKLYLNDEFDPEEISSIDVAPLARATDGFSGREIVQLVTGIKAAALLEYKPGQPVSPVLADRILKQFIAFHQASLDLKAFA